MYYLQSRYYDPEIGRFVNADTFASTGQGLLGNNMFAYCNNCPVLSADYNGKLTVTIGYGIAGTFFVGASASKSVTFDKDGVSYQYSYSTPKERETTTIGLFSAGFSYFIQATNKEYASELEGISTYLGTSAGKIGLDVVGDKPVADHGGELIGAQVSIGVVSAGMDVHVAQTNTETTEFVSWEEVWYGIKKRLNF